MKQYKQNRWWAITYINSERIMPDTIRETRRDAKKACCDNRPNLRSVWGSEWKDWKKNGCNAVRVIVQREEDMK